MTKRKADPPRTAPCEARPWADGINPWIAPRQRESILRARQERAREIEAWYEANPDAERFA